MEIKLYNSLSKKVEVFKPIRENEVSMYVCGPTVYNHAHIGNGRPVVFFDSVRRFFEAAGYTVKYVSNFTDIDDKIIKQAQKEGVPEGEISQKYIDAYLSVCDRLHCKPLFRRPRVTECMNEITDFIEELVKSNHAYTVGNDTFFSVRSIENYGQLSGQKLDDLKNGARIDVTDDKHDSCDFVLWKKTADEGIKWPSRLGEGRPGWHTECVVMIDSIFHGMIDIHGGGNDLKFPHHENEIAQSIALHNHSIANYWLHNARLDLDGEKMSKSLGNIIWVKDLLDEYTANAYRLLILSSQYRSSINYSKELMEYFKNEDIKIERVYNSLFRKLELADMLEKGNVMEDIYNRYLTEISNDFNFTNGITVLYELLKMINVELRSKDNLDKLADLFATFNKMIEVLGLEYHLVRLSNEDKELVISWQEAKAVKDFAKADELRAMINEKGIIL